MTRRLCAFHGGTANNRLLLVDTRQAEVVMPAPKGKTQTYKRVALKVDGYKVHEYHASGCLPPEEGMEYQGVMLMSNSPIVLKGRLFTTPKFTASAVMNRKRVQAWLYEVATQIAEEGYEQTLVSAINCKRMSEGDVSLLNQLIFG